MNNLSGKPQVMKKVNSALIKQILKEKGSATKAQITEHTGISATTVRTLLEELIINKEIISLGLDNSSGGRKAERYTLNLNDNISLSFYVQNEFINYALTNPLGDIIENSTVKIEKNTYKKSLERFIDEILQNNNIKVIGIGVPGVVDKGNYFSGKGLTDWKKSNIGEYIEEKYNIPVVLENNLNAIALGFSLNYLKEMKTLDMKSLNLIYVNFSDNGVGAGIITNGQLIRGENNFAGELGFIPINNQSHLEHILNNNPSDETYVDVVSQVIAILNCVINPSFIVLGGATLRKYLINEIKAHCKKYLANNIMPKIIFSEYNEKDYLAGITYLATEFMYSDIKLIKNER